MKTLVLSVALLAICSAAPEDYHETLDDFFDFTKVSSQEIRDGAFCLNDEGPCSELFASYKQHYPTVIMENCARCNSDQKKTALVYFDRLKNEWPQDFQKFLNKYDPQRQGWDRFYQTLKGARA
ncbi:allergen Tha p 1-like [Aricia agestis]|uniref:allergen Tha p 1-like n=1 Tax=Aricia agestis TaxID=91739 RepID=UPI001C2024E2|nr:allergen Tha p 1-like [Aricia agestis]